MESSLGKPPHDPIRGKNRPLKGTCYRSNGLINFPLKKERAVCRCRSTTVRTQYVTKTVAPRTSLGTALPNPSTKILDRKSWSLPNHSTHSAGEPTSARTSDFQNLRLSRQEAMRPKTSSTESRRSRLSTRRRWLLGSRHPPHCRQARDRHSGRQTQTG